MSKSKTEISKEDKRIFDIGGIKVNDIIFQSPSLRKLRDFISDADFLCGHKIIHPDLKYINEAMENVIDIPAHDRLYLLHLLFPQKSFYSLLKDDKLLTDEKNNPVNDSKKAKKSLYLSVFKQNQPLITSLRSEMSLSIKDRFLMVKKQNKTIPAACFSKAFSEKISVWKNKGYVLVDMSIQFIVSWKGENEQEEIFTLLPVVKLKRNGQGQ